MPLPGTSSPDSRNPAVPLTVYRYMRFTINFDYLCPFARNANEAALLGNDWEVTYEPFSLAQAHRDETQRPVWDDPEGASGIVALQWGIAVRDNFSYRFPEAHRGLFAARHDRGLDINDESVVRSVIADANLDADKVAEVVASGEPMATIRRAHLDAVEKRSVFGVPTITTAGSSFFVRLMERGNTDDLERVLQMAEWSRLNEFKRTVIPR